MRRWLDGLAMRWLAHRYGWPVSAGRDFFYEPDQPVEEIERAWAMGTTFVTTAPPVSHGVFISPSSFNVIFRNNIIESGD